MTDIIDQTRSPARRLSKEEIESNRRQEPALISAWQRNGCESSLVRLVERYRPMIQSQISRILAGRSVGPAHRGDLEQEATLAFIQAVSAYDPGLSKHLTAFAVNHVRKSLLRYALDYRHPYRIGTSSNERKAYYAALSRRARKIAAGGSDMLTDAEIREIRETTGASEKSTRRAVDSIYASNSSIEDSPDIQGPDRGAAAENEMAMTTALETLQPFISELDERQAAILEAYLSDGEVSAREIAGRFGVTPERIGQIRREMLADMAIFLKKKDITAEDLF